MAHPLMCLGGVGEFLALYTMRPCAKPSITHELERLYYNPSCPGQLQPPLM